MVFSLSDPSIADVELWYRTPPSNIVLPCWSVLICVCVLCYWVFTHTSTVIPLADWLFCRCTMTFLGPFSTFKLKTSFCAWYECGHFISHTPISSPPSPNTFTFELSGLFFFLICLFFLFRYLLRWLVLLSTWPNLESPGRQAPGHACEGLSWLS